MTLDEVIAYFGSTVILNQVTGMSRNNIANWKRMGYVPILSQVKIERRTGGALKANLEDTHADVERDRADIGEIKGSPSDEGISGPA